MRYATWIVAMAMGACGNEVGEVDAARHADGASDAQPQCDTVDLCADTFLELTVTASDATVLHAFVGTGSLSWTGETFSIDCGASGSAAPTIVKCRRGPDYTYGPSHSFLAQGSLNVLVSHLDGLNAASTTTAEITLAADDGAAFAGSVVVTRSTRNSDEVPNACAQACTVFTTSVTLSDD